MLHIKPSETSVQDQLVGNSAADGVILATLLGVLAKATNNCLELMEQIANNFVEQVLNDPAFSEGVRDSMAKRIDFVFRQAQKITN